MLCTEYFYSIVDKFVSCHVLHTTMRVKNIANSVTRVESRLPVNNIRTLLCTNINENDERRSEKEKNVPGFGVFMLFR